MGRRCHIAVAIATVVGETVVDDTLRLMNKVTGSLQVKNIIIIIFFVVCIVLIICISLVTTCLIFSSCSNVLLVIVRKNHIIILAVFST